MTDRYSLTITDYDGEASSFGFETATVNAANFDAQNTLRGAFYTATLDMMLGVVRSENFVITGATNRAVPTNQAAQRELKFLVTMIDGTVDKFFQFEIPCANTALLAANNSYLVKNGSIQTPDTGGEIAAFIAATEAVYVSPYGNAAEVWNIELVGRNI